MATPGRKHIYFLFVVMLFVFIGTGIGVQRSVLAYEDIDEYMKKMKVLTKVLVTIQKNYVDSDKTKTEDLVKGAIHGMVSSLDRYSVFLEVDEAKEFDDQTEGSFGGLGIQIKVIDGWLTVLEPLPDTPASKAQLLSGDRIVEIEGVSMRGISIEKAIKQLKGEPDTQVTISIARKGETELIKKTLTRAIINVSAVPNDEQIMLDSSIGYIRLRDFTRDASEELEKAIRKLEDEGMRGLVLDLRDNVGGLLDVAVSICDLFLEKDKIIVSQKDCNDFETTYYSKKKPVSNFALAVLVNEYSASASEIVAGCLQDHKRGIIVGPVGHRTFGKGLVQTVYDLPSLEGARLKITTAKYYTPAGKSIDEQKGLLPDIFAQVTDEQRRAVHLAGKVGYLHPAQTGKKVEEKVEQEADPDKPVTVDEIFEKKEESEQDQVYDIELYTAYQCIKGAVLLQSNKESLYSLANPRN